MLQRDPTTLAAPLAKLEEAMRLFQKGLAELRAGLGQLPIAQPLGETEMFELIVDRRRTLVAEAHIDSIDPSEFDIFLDLVFLRMGRNHAAPGVQELGETGLKARDVGVLGLMMTRQGRPVTHADVGDPRDGGMEPNTMRKSVWRLRRALNDEARNPRLIVTESIVHGPGGGFGYRIPRGLHTCLIRPAPLHAGDSDEEDDDAQ